jgi:hypothetical protein
LKLRDDFKTEIYAILILVSLTYRKKGKFLLPPFLAVFSAFFILKKNKKKKKRRNGMFPAKLMVLTIFTLMSCSQIFASSVPSGRQFFQNSIRGDANQMESDWTANVKGCAAFFLETNNGSVMMASARHCFNYAITNWCQTDGKIVTNTGKVGRCKRVVAAQSNYDISVFEASFDSPPNPDHLLRLASFTPPLHSKLVMIGYPADKYRKAKLTTTKECWVLQESKSSPHYNLREESSLHNCTTYGGNSGGPMVLEGTNVAIGLPFTYSPGDYFLRDPWKLSSASHLAQMADFIRRKRSELEEAGVVIVEEVPEQTLYMER